MDAETGRLKMLSTAGLIARFYEGCPLKEIYEMILSHYERLLTILEDPETASEVSVLMGLPANKVRDIAESIIVRLLYNKSKDAYISLGLRHDTSISEAHQRWQRLMKLYHPDRRNGSGMYDDKAKQINEAFAEINKKGKEVLPTVEKRIYTGVTKEREKTDRRAKMNKAPFLSVRYIPIFILGLAVLIALFMLSFCISRVVSTVQ